MWTSCLARAPRHAAVLATIAGLHLGAFVLVLTGLGPRIDWLEPSSSPVTILPPPPVVEPVVAPAVSAPVEYSPPAQPKPPVDLPAFPEPPTVPRAAGASSGTGAGRGPTIPEPDIRPSALRHPGSSLAALIDACYPSASRRLAEEGRVVVRIDIDPAVRARSWGVVEGSGFPRLDAAVECVVRRLEFTPGRRDGQAVAASALVPIVFRLD